MLNNITVLSAIVSCDSTIVLSILQRLESRATDGEPPSVRVFNVLTICSLAQVALRACVNK